MKKILILAILSSLAFAKLNVVVTYPYIADLVDNIAGDKVNIKVLATGDRDPHHIVPKPSLILKLLKADILISNGASLETAWLEPLVTNAGNSKINKNSNGFLDLSQNIKLIEKPVNITRANGDVHAEGNPHFVLDPYNIKPLTLAILARLKTLDPKNSDLFVDNASSFISSFEKKIKVYESKMSKTKYKSIIQYHPSFNYFLKRFGIKNVANIEPLPGVTPSSKYILKLISIIKEKNIKLILQDVYHKKDTAEFLSKKTGIKIASTPHDLYGNITSIEKLFDTIVRNFE